MSKIASQVYLICNQEKLKAFESLVSEVKSKNNVEIILSSEVVEIVGENKLEKIKIIDNISQKLRELNIDGLFIEIGHEPKTEVLAGLVVRDNFGQVIADLNAKTSCEGIFAR